MRVHCTGNRCSKGRYTMKKPFAFLLAAFFVIAVGATSACSSSNGGGDTKSINGMVTRTDTSTQTFSVKGKDGKDYEFKMVKGSKGDIKEIKEHQDLKKEVEVK